MSFIVLLLLQDCFLTMGPAWYQSLIKVLLNRFPQSCRHFDDSRTQYLVRRTNVRLTNETAVGFSAVKGKTVWLCSRLFWTRSSPTVSCWSSWTPKQERRSVGIYTMTRLYVVAQMFVYFMYFLLLGSESEGGVSGAAALTAPGWQQPPSPAGVHVPPPGVCHQHGLLQPLDWAAVTTVSASRSTWPHRNVETWRREHVWRTLLRSLTPTAAAVAVMEQQQNRMLMTLYFTLQHEGFLHWVKDKKEL